MFLQYPKTLTNKDWQKKKGLVGKATKTGLGSELDSLEKAFGKLDQAKLTAGGYGKLHDDAEVDAALADAKKYYAKTVPPIQDQARKVRDLAQTLEKDFKKSRTIPKSATKAVGEIAAAADHLALGLKSFDAEFATFDEAKAKIKTQIDMSKKKMASDMKNLDKAIDDCLKVCKKDPEGGYKAWEDNVHQRCRSVNNGLAIVPEWKAAHFGSWQKWGDHYHEAMRKKAKKDAKKETALIVDACDELSKELKKLDKAIA